MKIKRYKILSFLSVMVFFSYWALSILWALPDFKFKNSIQQKIKLPNTIFVSEWKLFTPPFKNDQRLYYIIRDLKKTSVADTIEVLENISMQKQFKAPFNQKELIIDYLVNKNAVRLSRTGWGIQKKTGADSFPFLASDKEPRIATADNVRNYNMSLSSLINFGGMVLKERNINIDGKEVKIVIKQKKITLFKEMYNTNFVRKETTVFESPYMTFK